MADLGLFLFNGIHHLSLILINKVGRNRVRLKGADPLLEHHPMDEPMQGEATKKACQRCIHTGADTLCFRFFKGTQPVPFISSQPLS